VRYSHRPIAPDLTKAAEAQAENMGVLAGLSWRHTDAATKDIITSLAPVLAGRLTLVDELAAEAGIALP